MESQRSDPSGLLFLLVGTSRKCPFPEAYLQEAWSATTRSHTDWEGEGWYDHPLLVTRSFSFLTSASRLSSSIRKLALYSLPIDLFVKERLGETQKILKDSFINVQDLRIGVAQFGYYINYKGPDIARCIGQFLRSMRDLRSLDISWNLGCPRGVDFQREWHENFYNTTWPHLESICLQRMDNPSPLLSEFFFRHAPTLKRVSFLHDPPVVDKGTSTREILTGFKNRLKLENFQIIFDQLYPTVILRYIMKNGNQPLIIGNSLPTGGQLNYGKEYPHAKLFEMFVLGECPWPMKQDQILEEGRTYWNRLDEWAINPPRS